MSEEMTTQQCIKRAEQREARLLQLALESERAGDTENALIAMMARAENARFITKLKSLNEN